MNRLAYTLLALLAATTLQAQVLRFHLNNHINLLVPADQAGEMLVNGTQITLGDNTTTLNIADIDSITYYNDTINTQLVDITWTDTYTTLDIPLDVYPYLTITQDQAYLTITSTAIADPEITYQLQGWSSNGAFTLDGEYKCGVTLNGLTLTSQQGAAIHIKNGKRIDLILADGTENLLADYAAGTQDACLHIKGHPEIKGGGSLYLTGNAKHAYKSGEYTYLKPSTGYIGILAAQRDAMHVGQYFQMHGGTIDISNQVLGDGIQVEMKTTTVSATDLTEIPDTTKELNGMCFLDSGIVNINLAGDTISAIKCDSTLYCGGGTYNITVTGMGAKGVNVNHNAYIRQTYSTPSFTITASGDYLEVNGDKKRSTCFKVDGYMYFYAGTIANSHTGDKSRGIKVGADYYYNPTYATVTPDNDVTATAIRVTNDTHE